MTLNRIAGRLFDVNNVWMLQNQPKLATQTGDPNWQPKIK